MIYFQASTVVGDSIRRWRINSKLIMKMRSGESGERLPLSWDFDFTVLFLRTSECECGLGCLFMVSPLMALKFFFSLISWILLHLRWFCFCLNPLASVVAVFESPPYAILSPALESLSLSLSHTHTSAAAIPCFKTLDTVPSLWIVGYLPLSVGRIWTSLFFLFSLLLHGAGSEGNGYRGKMCIVWNVWGPIWFVIS